MYVALMPSAGWKRFGVAQASIFTCLTFLFAVASGDAEQHKRLPLEPLEKYENAPMYIFRLGDLGANDLVVRRIHECSG